jgi:hypothetical protein
MSITEDLSRISAIGNGELSDANIAAIKQLYNGLVLAADVEGGTIDLAAPLFQAISNRIDQFGFESTKDLCEVLSLFLWRLLTQKADHLHFKDVLTIVSDNKPEIVKIASHINNIDNEILLNLHLYKSSKSLSVYSFLKVLCDFYLPFSTLVRQLEKDCLASIIPKSIEDHLFDLITMLKTNLESELGTLLLLDHKTLVESLSIFRKSKQLSSLANKCVEKVFEIIDHFLLPKYPNIFMSNQSLLSDRFHLLKFLDNLEFSFRFILEMLDHGVFIDYSESPVILSSLALSCSTIYEHLKKNKLETYTIFNKLNSKISFSTMSIYLNFLISMNLMNGWKTLPKLILSKFKPMFLPPLPRSLEFFLEHTSTDAFGNDCGLVYNSANLDNLSLALTMDLEVMLLVTANEFEGLKLMNTYTTESIQQKLVMKISDFMISSLTSTLIATNSRHDGIFHDRIQNLVYENLHNLVNSDTTNSMQWVNLLDFANDICYSDLHCIEILESLFDTLIKMNPDIGQSSLITSGLKFFIQTFAPNSTQLKALGERVFDTEELKEIHLDDYNYIYDAYPKPTIRLEPKSSGTVMSHGLQNDNSLRNYATNSARQQSIHVDEYGRD